MFVEHSSERGAIYWLTATTNARAPITSSCRHIVLRPALLSLTLPFFGYALSDIGRR